MSRKWILCYCMGLLLFTACGQEHTITDLDSVNIICRDFQVSVIEREYREAHDLDQELMAPNFITDADFNSYQEWRDYLIKALLTRQTDIDIFYFDNSDTSTHKILEYHYFVDLSEDEELVSCFDDMYPEIKEWCSYGDEFFCMPYEIIYYMNMMVDPGQLESVGYTVEDMNTIDGLLDFCNAWSAKNRTDPIEGRPLYDLYIMNYMAQNYDWSNGELDLDSPAFRSILTQCRDLCENEEIFNRPAGRSPETFTFTAPIVFSMSINPKRGLQYVPLSYPLLDGESSGMHRVVGIHAYAVNPSGKHREQAMKYMGLIANEAKRGIPSSLLYKDVAMYPDEIYTQDRLDMVGSILPRMTADYLFPGFETASRPCYEYVITGAKTLDEAISEAQHILDTVRKEQYLD